MARLGLPPQSILPSERGAPRWHPAIVGSMTHCAGYRAAALARREAVSSLGIDAEPNLPLPDGLLDSIALPAERRQVQDLQDAVPSIAWDRLLFSIKESVFKTWYPLTGKELDFHQARISFDGGGRGFHARLLVDPPNAQCPPEFTGRWTTHQSILISSIALPVNAPARPAASPIARALDLGHGRAFGGAAHSPVQNPVQRPAHNPAHDPVHGSEARATSLA
jgi:4'-phosphopantetheinyl transferase EntD